MPSCTIVRIICAQEGKHQKFWSVVPGGGLKLGSESEAQYFVCHSEQADLRSCLIQHLQSGAFIQQAPDRKLVLALSPASALPFSKLAAYSEGEEQVARDSVWLRAATGGVVSSNRDDELAVAVNATQDCPARECSFTFEAVDANSLLMRGLASHSPEVHKLAPSLKLQNYPASVSIAAKPVSSPFSNRSAAVPIALKRPIRKVSFSDLSALDHSTDGTQKSAPLHSSLPRKSSSFSRSYSLKDAFSNRIPLSPSCSNHSEGSDTDESKVRGGHHFDSDQISSTDSLSLLEQSVSDMPDSSAATSSPCDTLPSSSESQPLRLQHDLIPSHTFAAQRMPSRASESSPAAEQHEQDHAASTRDQLGSSMDQLDLSNDQHGSSTHRSFQPNLSVGFNDDKVHHGRKAHGGNLFKQGGLRSMQSTSSLSSIPNRSHAGAHRALKGHRTHGSQTALNFLSGNLSPSSPHRIPRAAVASQGFAQSAPVVGQGLLASEGRPCLHGAQSHDWSHGQSHESQCPSANASQSPSLHAKLSDSVSGEGLAAIRLSRSSGDSHLREPMLPCIYEGAPSQDSETLEQSAVATLLSRCGQKQPSDHGVMPFLPILGTAAKWPRIRILPTPPQPQQPKGSPYSAEGSVSPSEGSNAFQPKTKDAPFTQSSSVSASDSPCFCSALKDYIQSCVFLPSLPVAGMKRVCSSPDMHDSTSSLHHPAIHKVTPRGSPSDCPSPPKRPLHTHTPYTRPFGSRSTSQMATLGSSLPV